MAKSRTYYYIGEMIMSTEEEFQKQGFYKEEEHDETDIDQNELKKGIVVEMEHTNNKNVSKQIALDHLIEIPDYYTRLEKMEAIAMNKVKSPYKEIIKFFQQNKNPSDKLVHQFAEKNGFNEHKFEEMIYKLVSWLV